MRIESRGDLNTHTGREKNQIQVPQVRLLVPRGTVVLDQSLQDGLRDILLTLLPYGNHDDEGTDKRSFSICGFDTGMRFKDRHAPAGRAWRIPGLYIRGAVGTDMVNLQKCLGMRTALAQQCLTTIESNAQTGKIPVEDIPDLRIPAFLLDGYGSFSFPVGLATCPESISWPTKHRQR